MFHDADLGLTFRATHFHLLNVRTSFIDRFSGTGLMHGIVAKRTLQWCAVLSKCL